MMRFVCNDAIALAHPPSEDPLAGQIFILNPSLILRFPNN
jgi:hypothetical protein